LSLNRLIEWEDGFVKYAFGNEDQSILGTLVPDQDFSDEMQLRISVNGDRFTLRGHKSIMDKLKPDEIKHLIEKRIKIMTRDNPKVIGGEKK
jgi:hypothetical protein